MYYIDIDLVLMPYPVFLGMANPMEPIEYS
jgi:hypothetical protein